MPNAPSSASPFLFDCRGLPLDCRPHQPFGAHVMGVLNVTPDSFYDGGLYESVDDALRYAEEMIAGGARLIDIGGESSRPRGKTYGEGATPVDVEEEIERVVPVVRAIASRFPETILSVDTYKPEVARATLDAGAHIINDITGLRYFPETATIAAEAGAPMIVMHALGRPGAMPHEHQYDDVVAEVYASLQDSIDRAEAGGVRHIATDPGFGFGKTPEENLRLLNRVDKLLNLKRPVLVGISRKSTIGTILGRPGPPAPKADRLYGSLGATAVAVLRGATLVRTHDVRATVECLQLLGATASA